MKKFFNVILWPLIFIFGQFFIENIFVSIFNSRNIDIYRKLFPNFTDIEIISNARYKTDLLNYINSKALIMTLISFIIFGLIFLVLIKRYKKNSVNFNLKNIIFITILALSISIFYNTFIYLINNNIHITDNYNKSDISIIILILTTGIMGPILEELLFRGIVYNRLLTFVNHKEAIIFTSLLFSIMHMPDIITVIYTFLLSIIMIYLYNKFKTIKASIIFHIFINITIIFLVNLLILNNIIVNVILFILSMVMMLISLKKINLI